MTYLVWCGLSATVIALFDRLVVILSVATLAEGLKVAFVTTAWYTLVDSFLSLSLFNLLLALFQRDVLEEFLFLFF